LNSSVYCARFALTVIVSSPCLSLHTQQEIRFSGARSHLAALSIANVLHGVTLDLETVDRPPLFNVLVLKMCRVS
ncbi:hypothetical protein, partial [Paraburkholderia nemoris]|uniref:hypothetical protein n=1 Tax=Paraburkholderia nemoris TaxID=2793076 RepID=UPI001B8BA87E